jgi:hypothetical protein
VIDVLDCIGKADVNVMVRNKKRGMLGSFILFSLTGLLLPTPANMPHSYYLPY